MVDPEDETEQDRIDHESTVKSLENLEKQIDSVNNALTKVNKRIIKGANETTQFIDRLNSNHMDRVRESSVYGQDDSIPIIDPIHNVLNQMEADIQRYNNKR